MQGRFAAKSKFVESNYSYKVSFPNPTHLQVVSKLLDQEYQRMTQTEVDSGSSQEETANNVSPKAGVVEQASGSGRRTTWYVVAGVALAAIVATAIAVPLAVCNDPDKCGSSKRSSVNSAELDTNVRGNVTVSQTNSTNPTGTNTTGTDTNSTKFPGCTYTSDGPLNGELPCFGPGVLQGYESDAEFSAGVEQATRIYLDEALARNLAYGSNGGYDDSSKGETEDGRADSAPTGGDASGESMTADGSASYGQGVDATGVNDYGTNNQEEGVEEGDIITSNGQYVYGAYGDFVLVWSLDGNLVQELKLPSIECPDYEPPIYYPEPMPVEGDGGSGGAGNSSSAGSANATTATKQAMDSMPGYWCPTPYVRALLLVGDRLVVVADGFGQPAIEALQRTPIIANYMGTRAYIHSISSTGTLAQVAVKDFNGYYSDIRAVGNNVHVVTMSGINTYEYLDMPIERYGFPASMTNDEYLANATQIAERAIPDFAAKLQQELAATTGSAPRMVQLSVWHTTTGNAQGGSMQSLAQVHSFDISAVTSSFDVAITGAFMPGWGGQVYASTSALVIAGQGWDYSASRDREIETTYLLSLMFAGASTNPHSVATIDGYVINSYSMDVVGDVMRVATTVRAAFIAVDFMEGGVVTERSSGGGRRAQEDPPENYIITLQMPGASGTDPGEMTELDRIQLGHPGEIFTTVRYYGDKAYAVTFERTDPFYVIDLSDPANIVQQAALEITGYSSFLQPMNDEQTLLLGIGEEADSDGNTLGLKITVFNAVDPTNPTVGANYVFEQDAEVYSGSTALWDIKAIRYNRETGLLIIPVERYDYNNPSNNFQGFQGLLVTPTSITESCTIEHGNAETGENVCYYCASLQARSMIFNGALMTTFNHFIRSTILATCQQSWELDVVIAMQTDTECCNWYIF